MNNELEITLVTGGIVSKSNNLRTITLLIEDHIFTKTPFYLTMRYIPNTKPCPTCGTVGSVTAGGHG